MTDLKEETKQEKKLSHNPFISGTGLQEGLTFDDVLLVPKFSDIEHRADVCTSSEVMPGITLEKPFISANMDTITEFQMAIAMAENGCLGILHRFLSIEQMLEQIDLYNNAAKEAGITQPFVVSVGVHDQERIKAAYDKGIRHFCIDVAHGHHILVKRTIEHFRSTYNDVIVIAGNVCTYDATYDLFSWGADCVKVGIGPGSVCSTRIKTGVGYPQLSAVMHSSRAKKDFEEKNNTKKYIIADGGIKNYGDVTKAMAAGADSIMMGSIFSGCKQTPGRVMRNEKEEIVKSFRGMASSSAQTDFGIEDINEEGIAVNVKYKGNISHILTRLSKGLKSGMSYCASHSIQELQESPNFVKVTQSSIYEGTPHKANRL